MHERGLSKELLGKDPHFDAFYGSLPPLRRALGQLCASHLVHSRSNSHGSKSKATSSLMIEYL